MVSPNAENTSVGTSGSSGARQPGVLYMLFATEAWERFSFYGMKAILKLYMTRGLLWSHDQASLAFGLYAGATYLTPVVGGYVADRRLGYRRAILVGAACMAVGQFFVATRSTAAFWIGLAWLVVGSGLFKPNISSIVGTLYEPGDPRRDRGFTIFYMGINLGAAVAPVVCGQFLGENDAWLGQSSFAWGFRAAGVGMLVGLVTFAVGRRWLGSRGLAAPRVAPLLSPSSRHDHDARPLDPVERRRVACIFVVALFVVFFWAAFEQAGNTMTTWADANTNRTIFGWEMKASFFQFFNPVFILVLAPVVSWVWKTLGRRGKEPSTPAKLVLGLVFLGIGFLPLVAAAAIAGPHGKASWSWLVLAYLLHTIGELCLSPSGLSFVTKLAPRRLASFLMGVWFLALSVGNLLAGVTGVLYGKMAPTAFFGLFVVSSFVAAAGLFSMLGLVRRLTGGID